MLKYLIYNAAAYLLPKSIINTLGSLKILKSLRDWLFDRNNVLKPRRLITWNNLEFYFQAPLQILRKARIHGIENSLTKSILNVVNKDSNIIDIGSNYGFITLVCSIYIREGKGTVFSFECDTHCYKNLECSISKNGLKNIQLFNEFLGNENNRNMKTVDSLLYGKCENIDLIKIDTDGTDFECLKGCTQIINQFHPVIVIEINNNFDQIIKYLKEMGYRYFYDQFLRKVDDKLNPNVPNLFSSKYGLKV